MQFPFAGDASTLSFAFTHNLATKNVTHEIYDTATGETVAMQFTRTSANAVRLDVGAPLGAGTNFTLVIRAEVDPT